MPTTVKLEDGTEVEAMTPEEVEQVKQEAIDAFKAENPDKTAELAELQEKLREAEEALAKKGDADKNFANLRKAKDDAETKINEFTKTLDEKVNQVKREVIEGVNKDFLNEKLTALAGDDEELRKKIEFEYNTTLKGVVPSSKAEIAEKLNKAYVLANPSEVNALNSSVISSGGVGRLNIKGSDKKFTPEEKEIGKKFGLTDADFAK